MRKIKLVVIATVLVAGLVACNKKHTTDNNANKTDKKVVETVDEDIEQEEMFSKLDYQETYDKSKSATIKLDGDSVTCNKNSVDINEGKITIKDEGTYIVTGKLNDGMIVVDAGKSDNVQIVLKNANIFNKTSAAIYIKQAKKAYITLDKGSKNLLKNGDKFEKIDNNNIDGVIFSKDDVTFNGEGELSIGTKGGHAIVSKEDLVVTNGKYDIKVSESGIIGKGSVRVGGGYITIEAKKDGIHSENIEEIDKGYVYVDKGDIKITAGDDGIHASSNLIINKGNINIVNSYEGLEGNCIDILDGKINIVSSDDGMNAAGGNDKSGFKGKEGQEKDRFVADESCYINISGGKINIDAEGDGIDSNGSFLVAGGETYINGPTRDGNDALDYGIDAQITGGIFVATGTRQMVTNFGNNSGQGSILVEIKGRKKDKVRLIDDNKKELLKWTTKKDFETILISTKDIEVGKKYEIKVGDNISKIKMDNLIYGGKNKEHMEPGHELGHSHGVSGDGGRRAPGMN